MRLRGGRINRLHHHAHHRLGATRAQKHAAVLAECLLSGGHGSGHLGAVLHSMLVVHTHVNQGLRHLLHDLDGLGHGLAGTDDRRQELAGRHEAVARGVVIEQNHVAGLLAADGVAVLAHGLQNVAVAYLGLHHVDAHLFHGAHETEVAHHRGHNRVAGQHAAFAHIERADRFHHIAVDLGAIGRHEHDAVSIAIMRNTHIGTRLGHKRAQGLEMSGAAPHVDVHAVEIIVDDAHLGAQPPQSLRGRERGSTVTRIQSDAQALEGNALLLDGAGCMIDVNVASVFQRNDHAHLGTSRHLDFGSQIARRIGGSIGRSGLSGAPGSLLGGSGLAFQSTVDDEGLDLVFHGVGQLETLGVEELDAVVLRRIVRGGDDRAARRAHLAHEQGHARRGDDACLEHGTTGTHDARGKGGAQHVAGAARVATHNDSLAEIDGGGLAETIGHLAGQLHICDTAHAISSKQSGHEILLSFNSGAPPKFFISFRSLRLPRDSRLFPAQDLQLNATFRVVRTRRASERRRAAALLRSCDCSARQQTRRA